MKTSQTVAFVGTGIMGLPMVGHLLAGGHEVVIHSRTRSRAAELEQRGAIWADTPAAAVRRADVICLCLPDTPDVDKAIFGESGVLEGARPGTIIVDHSTISPIATQDLAKRLAAKEVVLLDAPLSGGDVGARNGTLAIMVGGDAGALERVRPILQRYGKTITHCGGAGAGQFTKMVNQVLVSLNLTAVCEALKLATAAGLDVNTTIQAVAGGAAGSWQLQNLGPRIARGDYAPGFMIDLLLKDLRILHDSAAAVGVKLDVSALARRYFESAAASGHGRDGTQAVFESIRDT